MGKLAKALTASAGNAGGTEGYVEDVFSTFLWEGNATARSINNGIDLSGEGGLVWIKNRDTALSHALSDTARGANKQLNSNTTGSQGSQTTILTAFNNNGFSIGADSDVNQNAKNIASWSFRKANKFFDVLTYTGNATARTIAHNLGSVPGMIIIKQIDATRNWPVYHVSLGAGYWDILNTGQAAQQNTNLWNNTAPTDSVFSVGTDNHNNGSGGTYVAYLFASDAGGYGDDGTDSIIKCGAFSIPASGGVTVTLGWEPQWVLVKLTSPNGGQWCLMDTMRQYARYKAGRISPDNNAAEEIYTNGSGGMGYPTATGFEILPGVLDANYSGIYIAIRRGPMKIPEAGTEVYFGDYSNGGYVSGFPVDLAFIKDLYTANSADWKAGTRLVGTKRQATTATAAEVIDTSYTFDNMTGFYTNPPTNHQAWMFRRYPGFMDVVAYTGKRPTVNTVSHNLTVIPELIIVKSRSYADEWPVYCATLGASSYLTLNTTSSKSGSADYWNNATPTASVFTLGDRGEVNTSSATYISYLFATLAGISKVGTYTGNAGYAVNADCGFSNSARFILIKRTDAAGDWYVYDSARGITAGNSVYALLNSTAAEVSNTDYIDPLSSGFTVTASAPVGLNASSGKYIFLAIA